MNTKTIKKLFRLTERAYGFKSAEQMIYSYDVVISKQILPIQPLTASQRSNLLKDRSNEIRCVHGVKREFFCFIFMIKKSVDIDFSSELRKIESTLIKKYPNHIFAYSADLKYLKDKLKKQRIAYLLKS